MPDILGISSTAVGVYQRVLGVVSNNIANVGTEGYVKQQAEVGQTPPTYDGRNYLGTGAMFQGVQRQYNAFIESSLRNATSDVASQDALVRYAERVIDVMGSGEIGLSPAFDKFFSAARSLAADPSSSVLRGSLLREADGLAARFRDLSEQLNQVESETRGGINTVVSQVNVLTSQLAKLNVELSKQQSLTRQPPALLDQRDQLLRELSKSIDIRSEELANGMVRVSIGGPGSSGYVVDGLTALKLEAHFDEVAADRVDLVLDPNGTQTRSLSGMSGGEFGGLSALRLQVLEPAMGQLDWLAKTVTQEVNRIHQSGVDAKGRQGTDLFAIRPTFGYERTGSGTGQPLKVDAAVSDLNAYTGSPITLAFDARAGKVFGVSLLGPFSQGDSLEVTLNGRSRVMRVEGDTSVAAVTKALQTFIDGDANGTRSDEAGFGVQLRTSLGANGEISVSSPFLSDYQFGVKVSSAQGRAQVDSAQGLWVTTDPKTGERISGRQSLSVGGMAITIGGAPADGEQLIIKSTTRPAGAMQAVINDAALVAAAASFRGVRDVDNVGNAKASVLDDIATAFSQYPANVAGTKGGIANNPVASEALAWDATKQIPVGIIPAGQKDVVYYLDPKAASADLQIFTRDGRHLAGTGMSARPSTLQSVRIDTTQQADATITTNYLPGQANQNYIEFKARGEAGETLSFSTTASPSSVNGTLSLSGGALYRGNGVRAVRLGTVDAENNGQAGKPLRINLVSAFENSSFDNGVAGSSSIPGWTVLNQRVKLDGVDQIAGWPTPVNSTLPVGLTPLGASIVSPGEASSVSGSFNALLTNETTSTGSGLSVKLSSVLTVTASALAHGPTIVSQEAVTLREADRISVDWKASRNGDDFDVYGYLLNVDNGRTVPILDASGRAADWSTASATVPLDGQYRFVFVAGTHDFSGGTLAGSDFFIDNLRVTTTPTTLSSADVATLQGWVNYSNVYSASIQVNGQTITSDAGTSTLAAATSLQAKIQQKIAAGDLQNISVSRTGDDLTLTATDPTRPFAVGQLSFSSASGQIQATTLSLNDPGETNNTGQAFVGSHPVFNPGSTYSSSYINTLGEPGYRAVQTFYGLRATPLTVQPNGVDHLSQGDRQLPARIVADFPPSAQGVNIPQGAFTLNGQPMTGFTGNGAGAVASWINSNAGTTGIKAEVENGVVVLTRPVNQGDGSIQIGFGPGGSPRALASLGFRAGAYVLGEVPEDLVVFATGTGAVRVSATWQDQAWDTGERRQAQRATPFEVRFSSPTRYSIVDLNTGSELAARSYTPGSEIAYAGLRIRLSEAPLAGDTFRIDGNQDGLGDNTNALKLVDLEKSKIADPDKTLTFSESYLATVDKLSNVTQQAQTSLKALEVVKQQTSDAREAVSGVALDEEAANLIRFQQAYQAAAKSMQIASQMFEAVLRI